MPKAAAIYTRISDDRLGDGAGVQRQEMDCRALLEQKGWQLAGVYCDDNISAYSERSRPEYRRMLGDIKAGRVDAVVVWHLDRLHRSPRELEDFFTAVDKAGVTHLATVTGDINLGTHEGRLQARMFGGMARYESDHKSDRIKRKHLEIAAAGRVSGGGARPFGFEDDRTTLREAEAQGIRDAARRVLAGESLRGVARSLTSDGLITSAGRPWSTSGIKRVLTSARISGRREHHGHVICDAVWPAIITPTDSDRLRAVLRDPRRKGARPARRYLLAGGLARCGLCGAKLVSRPSGDGRRCYVCAAGPGFTGCGKIRSLAEPLEELITAAVIEALDGRPLARAIEKERRGVAKASAATQSLADDEAQLAQLARDFAERRISRMEWLAARDAIEHRLDDVRARLATEQRIGAVGKYAGNATALRHGWPTLSLDQRRAILSAVLVCCTVNSAVRGRSRFDPSRVGFTWRF